jgi:TRAP-type C4-dicarboxylate transport system substrate-binding protein
MWALPADVRQVVELSAPKYAALHRRETDAMNHALVAGLASRGMSVTTAWRSLPPLLPRFVHKL